ncbi:MAG: NADPH-dependent FMN reductase [Rhodospirillales bacterium]|jgi:chromate reductase
MSSKLKVLGISGSLRKASKNTGLLHTAQDLAPDDMTIDIFDLANIPFYNQDTEEKGLPDSVKKMIDAMSGADALLFACPEYNFSLAPALKNAIDWASRQDPSPMDDKPAAIMGVGGGAGSGRSQQHLRQVFAFTNTHAMNKPEVCIRMRDTEFDANNRPADQHALDSVSLLLRNLSDWTRRLRVFVTDYEEYPQGY